jgi:adenylate cyclase
MPLIVEAVTNRHQDEEAFWRGLLTGDDPGVPMYWMREVFGVVRSPERCKVCNIPFSGTGSLLFQALWSGPSNLTPHFCEKCEDFARRYHGGAEVEMTMLTVSVRGEEALAASMGAAEYRALLNRFYAVATDVLTDNGAWLDKFVGGEAIGLFIPGFAGADHAFHAMKAALELLEATGHATPGGGAWIPVGVGVNTGLAFMDTVGTGKVCDITALGDAVNEATRLAERTRPGQAAFSDATFESVGAAHTGFLDGLGLRRVPVLDGETCGSVYLHGEGRLLSEGGEAPEASAAGALQPGVLLERHEVVRLLGVGGAAQVWEVRHRALGTRHALKVLTWAGPLAAAAPAAGGPRAGPGSSPVSPTPTTRATPTGTSSPATSSSSSRVAASPPVWPTSGWSRGTGSTPTRGPGR